MTNHYANHEKLKKQVMIAVSATFEDIIALPYDTGYARAMDNPKRVYKYGQDGIPDLMIIGPSAEVRFIDIKTGKSGLSAGQKAWQKTLKIITGKDVVTVGRNIDEILEYLKKEYLNCSIRSTKL